MLTLSSIGTRDPRPLQSSRPGTRPTESPLSVVSINGRFCTSRPANFCFSRFWGGGGGWQEKAGFHVGTAWGLWCIFVSRRRDHSQRSTLLLEEVAGSHPSALLP